MKVLLVPLLGPWHLRFPAYNAVTLRDLLESFAPDAVATTALEEGMLQGPAWQDTDEVPLPLTLVPWITSQQLPLVLAGVSSEDPAAPADFRRYAAQYPALQARLQLIDAQLGGLSELFSKPLNLTQLQQDILPLLAEHQRQFEAEFGDGPATGWLRSRVTRMHAGMKEHPAFTQSVRLAILAPVEHLPILSELFQADAEVESEALPDSVPVSAAARERSLLDFAFRGDAPDPEALVGSLRELDLPEARFHEANILVATGHLEQGAALLENTSHGDFSAPYFLPGFLLARLGQLRDLSGNRREALKAYRAVRALSYAPRDALAAAVQGLAEPFSGEQADGSAS